jgi:hypothetical protein
MVPAAAAASGPPPHQHALPPKPLVTAVTPHSATGSETRSQLLQDEFLILDVMRHTNPGCRSHLAVDYPLNIESKLTCTQGPTQVTTY